MLSQPSNRHLDYITPDINLKEGQEGDCMKTDNRNIDAGKAAALRSAGWRTGRIAAEMGITPEAVEEALRAHAEKPVREQNRKDEEELARPRFVCLSAAELREIYEKAASVGAREAVRMFREEQMKADRQRARDDNKVKRTKKMLDSYRRIKATLSDETEFTEEEQIELRWKFIQDLMGNARETVSRSERVVRDEEKKRQEDLYCIFRIEKAVEMYRKECEKSGSEEAKRRYRELRMMYLDDKVYTVQEISQVEKVSDKTVYKDLGIACGIVAVYLLGM